jgi:hypothetical protein
MCVCAFLLYRESPDMILGDKPLIFSGGSIIEVNEKVCEYVSYI